MPREARRSTPPLTGSRFVRALAALDDTPVPASRDDAFAQRLSQWFDWTQAISLSAALGEASSARRANSAARSEDCGELARARSTLARRLAETCRDLAPDFAALHQQVLAWQLAMEAQIGPLRRRIRSTLATGPLARLAHVDAVMEQVMAPREHSLLAAAVQRLEPRHKANPDDFAQALQALLEAELELRLQPVEGLLAASGTPIPE
jgi:hypothetical protein